MIWAYVGAAAVVLLVGWLWLWAASPEWRNRSGVCARCRYSRAGLDEHRACPECGLLPLGRNANRGRRIRATAWCAALICAWCYLPGKLGGYALYRTLFQWDTEVVISVDGWTIEVQRWWLQDAEDIAREDWPFNWISDRAVLSWRVADLKYPSIRTRVTSPSGHTWAGEGDDWWITLPRFRLTPCELNCIEQLQLDGFDHITVDEKTRVDSFAVSTEAWNPGIFIKWRTFIAVEHIQSATTVSQVDHSWFGSDLDIAFDEQGMFGRCFNQAPLDFSPHSNAAIEEIHRGFELMEPHWPSTAAFYQDRLAAELLAVGESPQDDDAAIRLFIAQADAQGAIDTKGLYNEDLPVSNARHSGCIADLALRDALRGRADRGVHFIRAAWLPSMGKPEDCEALVQAYLESLNADTEDARAIRALQTPRN